MIQQVRRGRTNQEEWTRRRFKGRYVDRELGPWEANSGQKPQYPPAMVPRDPVPPRHLRARGRPDIFGHDVLHE